MVTCKLGEKTYCVDYITGRALREMGPAYNAYERIVKATEGLEGADPSTGFEKELDILVKWFCVVFGNQFTPDEFYDGYPVDRAVHDIVLTLLAVRSQTTEVLDTFPTMAAPAPKKSKG